jgi:hypothetical protein
VIQLHNNSIQWSALRAAADLEHCPYNRGLLRLPITPKVVDFVPQLELLERAALTITHGAGIAQLRYGDDGDPDRLRPARRAGSGRLMRQRRGCAPPSIGCGPIPLAGRTPSHCRMQSPPPVTWLT